MRIEDWNLALYSEVQRIMGNGPMRTPAMDRQTHTCENITLLQLRWRELKMKAKSLLTMS